MLAKNTDIEIPKDNPFLNDKLSRKVIAENLTTLIQSTNQPFVISIEAPWGWGKTTFTKMWKTHLEAIGHTCLYFNAWENDFVEDPLIAFIGEISKELIQKKGKGKVGSQIKKIQNIGGKIARRLLPLTIQLATQGLLSQETVKKTSEAFITGGKEVANFASELAEEKIKQYENDKKGILEFKKELTSLSKLLAEDNTNKSPLVFFIDELDRCRPDFSIFLLERVKHIFSVEGMVFILVMDRTQLEQSAKFLYGAEMKEDGYLRRFIDFRCQLPEPSTEDFCKALHQKFHLAEVFAQRNGESEETFQKIFVRFAEIYGFSLRAIEQCYTEINMIFRTTPANRYLNSHLVAFLVTMKSHNPEIFSSLSKQITYDSVKTIIQNLSEKLNNSDRLTRYLLTEIEAYLIFSCLSENESEKIYARLKDTAENSTADALEKKHAEVLIGTLQNYAYTPNRYTIKQLLARFNMLEQIIPTNRN